MEIYPLLSRGRVSITQKDSIVTVKGPKGELTQEINPNITVSIEDNQCLVARANDESKIVHYMVCIVPSSKIWLQVFLKDISKTLELVGVGV